MFAIIFEQLSPMPVGKSKREPQEWRAALRPITVLDGSRDSIWAQAHKLVASPVIEWHNTMPSQEKFDEHTARFLDLLSPSTNASPNSGSYLRTKVSSTRRAGISTH